MSPSGVSSHEMKQRFDHMNDPEIESLLAGRPLAHEPGLDGVAAFFESVGRTYPESSTGVCEASHVGAILEAANDVAAQGVPAAHPVTIFGRAAAYRRLLTRPGSLAAALGLAAALAFGGTAYAGILPAPLQALVAHAAHQVGIELPDPGAKPHESIHPASAGALGAQKATSGPQGVAGSINASGSAGVHPSRPATATAPVRGKSAQAPRAGSAKKKSGRKVATRTRRRVRTHGSNDVKAPGTDERARH